MKSIITISGKLGSGKSSAAKEVARILNYKHFSSGDFLRQVAHKRGISINKLMSLAESDKSIDLEIDHLLQSKKDELNTVIDSRLAFHWIPESFKVFLDIDPNIAAERMFQDLKDNKLRKKSEYAQDVYVMKENMLQRLQSDIKRYKDLYNIDYTQHDNFDLVIDTGLPENDLRAVVNMIIDEYQRRSNDIF